MIKFKQVFLASVLASSMVVTPVFADDVSNLQNSKNAAQSEVNSLQSELQTLIEKMSKLEDDLVSTGQQITQAQDDLTVAKEKEHQQYEDMKKRIKYMYEEGNQTAIETLISAGNFSDLLNKAEYVQNVHSYDRKQLQEYVETKQQISDLKDSLEKDQKELESKQAEYEKQGDNLNNLITSKSAEVANLDSEIQAAAEAAAKEAAERAAKEAAEKAAKEAAKKQQASAANNSTSSNRNNSTTSNNTTSNKNNTSNTTRPSRPSGNNTSSSTTKPSGNNTSSNTTSGSNANGGTIVSRAYSQLGKPYVWGACGPSSFDCSGFVSYCLTGSYTRLGTTLTFMGWTRVSNPQPGDVVTTATHCGIYIGNGQMIHAPHTGDVVKVGPVQSGMIYVRR